MKHIISILLICLILVLSVPAALAAEEIAPPNFIILTMNAGDSIYDLCRNYGIDFIAAKNTIMELNGWTQESQMNSLFVGDRILLPITNYYSGTAGAPVDDIAYYVVPYEIQPGDSLTGIYEYWGLDILNYANIIRLLNGVDNLDVLSVGTIYYLPTTAEHVYGGNYITVMSHVMSYGETAYDICSAYGIDYNQSLAILQAYNGGADLSRLPIGSELYIPVIN